MSTNKQQTIPKVLLELARSLHTKLKNRKLEIPEKFGNGYCSGFVFNEQMRMLICNYELYHDLTIENTEVDTSRKTIFFKFQNIFPESGTLFNDKQPIQTPSVLIATSRINTDDIISIHSNTSVINIEVDADYLRGLFRISETSMVLQGLLNASHPLLFEQIVYPSLQKIVDEILTDQVNDNFELFFFRIKAEELICRLLMELEKRDEKHLYALNNKDIQAIYEVKERILAHLSDPPVIDELAAYAHMSPTKLKRIFRQIFGNSIFNYYQEFRMKEAARLLKEEKLSVSEVGYELGFTNLGHFSRVFKEHIGMKPKQYSKT
ncbi:MAG: helix-turn-helix transcriptional regulator [Bacteroidetes bacterium]|nr:helix-turn-helix transcriptional regulator [Bacteroidota bacterium]